MPPHESESDHSPHRTTGRGAAQFTRLGKYELIARIGKGGMAQVYLARQRGPANFEKMVVVKTIHPHLAAQTSFIEMLLDEARIAALLKHPCVVDIYELGLHEETYFIAMEYLSGEPLLSVLRAARTKKRLLDVSCTARIVADVADGLHAAHELRDNAGNHLDLVHRDVTPGNIVVLYSGQVKIVDFGIAKARGRMAEETDARKLKGKLGYVSPEQVKGKPVDRRVDIFALGVVLWEALTYRRLFRGSKPGTVLAAIAKADIAPPSSVRPEIPAALDEICMRALARDPDDRYPTAEAMSSDLEAFLAGTGASSQRRDIAAYMEEVFAAQIGERARILREMHERNSAAERGPTDAIDVFAPVADDDDADSEVSLEGAAPPDEAPDGGETDDESASSGMVANTLRMSSQPLADAAPLAITEAGSGGQPAAGAGRPPSARLQSSPEGRDSGALARRSGSIDGDMGVNGEAPVSASLGREGHYSAQARAKRRWIVMLASTAGILFVLVLVALLGDEADDADAVAVGEPGVTAPVAESGGEVAAAGGQPSAASVDAAPLVDLVIHSDVPAVAADGTAGATDDGITGADGDRAGDVDDGSADGDSAAAGVAGDPPADAGGSESAGVAAAEQAVDGGTADDPQSAPGRRGPQVRRRQPRQRAAARAPVEPEPNKQARDADRAQAQALYKEGVGWYVKGQHGVAQRKFREALSLMPGYAKPHRGLGLVYEATGEREQALRSYRTYLRLAPTAKDRDHIQQRIAKLGG